MFGIKKNRPSDNDNNYASTGDAGYDGAYSDYGPAYGGADYGDDAAGGDLGYTESVAVDPTPDPDPVKPGFKYITFSSPIERENVAKCLQEGYPVIFNIENLERGEWYRVIDYLQGAIYILGGSLVRMSEFWLVAAPKGADISQVKVEDIEEEAAEAEALEEPMEEADAE